MLNYQISGDCNKLHYLAEAALVIASVQKLAKYYGIAPNVEYDNVMQ